MRICKHCGAGVPNYAGFCGTCGQLISISEPADRTLWKSHRLPSDSQQSVICEEKEASDDGEEDTRTDDNEQDPMTAVSEEEEEYPDNNEQDPMIAVSEEEEEEEYLGDDEQDQVTAISEGEEEEYTDDDDEQDQVTAISGEKYYEYVTGNEQTFVTAAPAEYADEHEHTLITAVAEEYVDESDSDVQEEEEEEESRRRLALIDTSLPLLADIIAAQATGGMPVLQGTPQMSGAPTVPGTPPIDEMPTMLQTPTVTGGLPPAGEGMAPLILSAPEAVLSAPFANVPPRFGQVGGSPRIPQKPQQQPARGCMTIIILVCVLPLLILGSIISIGFTFLAPALSLGGSTNVAVGGNLHLSGSHFIPGSTVTCVLDGGEPLSYSINADIPASGGGSKSSTGALLFMNLNSSRAQTTSARATSANTAIIVGGDGTFHVTFLVGQKWALGTHTIHATEALSPRAATITFTVMGNSNTPSGTVTSTTTATATATAIATLTPTPTLQVTPGISAITPNAITFGPISAGYAQPVSAQVIITTTGAQLLTWTASWNQAQAPWLQMNIATGQIQAPNAQTVVVSATVGNLPAGTYNSTVIFSTSEQTAQTFALPISLTVQAGCITATPTTLTFTATSGGADAAPQTVALNNCGALGNWSEATTGGSWLTVSPTGGSLNSNATQNIVVSTLLANVKSVAGTYQGQIVFSNGTAHATVNVTYVVQAAPKPPQLSVTPSSIHTLLQCTLARTKWICTGIMVSSSQPATGNLTWAATSTGIKGVVVAPASGTLQPGQTTAVEIDIPRFSCTATDTVTFTGPTNSVAVTITC